MSELVVHYEEGTFEEVVVKSELPVIVDFYADWCGPCKTLAPILEKEAKTTKKFKLVKVNIDECPNLAEQYEVSSIPFVILFKNGQRISDFTGFSQQKVDEMIKSL